MKKADIGLIGLAVMGANLVLNMESKGYTVSVYNRNTEVVDSFVSSNSDKKIVGTHSLPELVATLERPRKVMMMIKSGAPVDSVIEELIPLMDEGDVIIDGGNSHYPDTARRTAYLEGKGLLFIGTGVSGGEEGALKGPSIMPGGSTAAWPLVKDIFQSIAAKVDGKIPCCEWVGAGGAGHFVKMVHNGIEYGDMQLISEAYHLMRNHLNMTADEMAQTFSEWNKTELDSYLIEITADILAYKDTDGTPLVDKILDAAGQKGTGKWTGISALDEGVPLTLIVEAVFARSLSSLKDERLEASKVLTGPEARFSGSRENFLNNLRMALFAAKIISYTQGFTLIRAAAEAYKWDLNYGNIALMWRGGCIIRSVFLNDIKEAFDANKDLSNLLLSPYFNRAIADSHMGWREVIAEAALSGIPVPALSSALSYYDGYRTANLPANLLQAQRDYFGAHTYERTDRPRGEFFHTNWTGYGGDIASTVYNV